MKAYWHYQCDFGHTWSVLKDEDALENEADSVCPEGHPAVTLTKMPMADETQITIRPAARIGDRVTQQILSHGHYYLVVSNMDMTEELISTQTYSMKEILDLARRFDKRNWPWTKNYWGKVKL